MKPISTSWDVGKDKHGRRVVLTLDDDGEFSLASGAVTPRDEMHGLTHENLLAIGEVAKEVSQ